MHAPSLETIGMQIFGPLVAPEDVSIKVEPNAVHALLGVTRAVTSLQKGALILREKLGVKFG